MTFEMRQITDETFPAFLDLLSIPFSFDRSEEETENFRQVDELDRSFGVMDGEAMVGTFGAYTYELATPGGSVSAGGLTAVGVLPTHRRRGVLTAMIDRHYEDCRQRDEPVSILWASEWPIYGRFGYGQASAGVEMSIDTSRAELTGLAAPGVCRMVERAEAEEILPEVYERARGRAGFLSRPPVHWRHRHFFDPESWRDGATAYRYTVYTDGGEVDGYLKWRTKDNWEGGVPGGTARVLELISVTPAAERALWEFALNLDLITTVSAGRRPIDDGLWMMLRDRRRLQRRVHDALWVSILDVPTALASRRYAAEGELVIEVTDGVSGIDGSYRLAGSREGAECMRTDGAPDISLSASELGALYLGGSRLGPMAKWGTVKGDTAALQRADAMFTWDELPWCPEVF